MLKVGTMWRKLVRIQDGRTVLPRVQNPSHYAGASLGSHIMYLDTNELHSTCPGGILQLLITWLSDISNTAVQGWSCSVFLRHLQGLQMSVLQLLAHNACH